jgi:hypothetical protein
MHPLLAFLQRSRVSPHGKYMLSGFYCPCPASLPRLPKRDIRQRRVAGGVSAAYLESHIMSLGTILLVILILMVLGALPTWPHSRNWGYAPSGGLGLVLVILLVLFLLGRI